LRREIAFDEADVKSVTTIIFLLTATVAFAQMPPPVNPPTTADLENQMQQIGCKAERQAAASTIVSQQKEISDLQKQLAALKDPPKSGATRK
jgi:TolA-binding protein